MSEKVDLADTIFRALVARRELLRSGEGTRAVRIIGSCYSPEAMALRSFATRSRLAHTWIDLEDADDARPEHVALPHRPDRGRPAHHTVDRHPGARGVG